jgi:hypothetical protein
MVEIKELNFTLSTSTIEIEQGKDGIILASLINMGNTPLYLNSSVEKECCNVSLPGSFELPVKGEVDFSINIHVPLYQEVGEYIVKIELWTGFLTKEKAFKIVVKKSSSIASLEVLERKVSELESKLKEYQALGINVQSLSEMIERAKKLLSGARTGIIRDDLFSLENSTLTVEEIVNSISSSFPSLELQKFFVENKWNISAAIMTTLITSYMATQIIYPYLKLGKEIKALVEEEQSLVKARIETEKQYFMRKIDEQTFSQIMIEKQGKILKLRADIKRKKEERSTLIKQRLHPLAMVRWMKSGISRAGNFVKSLPKIAHENLKKKLSKGGANEALS